MTRVIGTSFAGTGPVKSPEGSEERKVGGVAASAYEKAIQPTEEKNRAEWLWKGPTKKLP